MDTRLLLVDGSTFFASDSAGDTSSDEDGLFFGDMRHLSVWRLTVEGTRVRLLTCETPQNYSAHIHATLPSARVGVNPTVSVRRDRIVATGVHEDIVVDNYGDEDCELVVELACGTDFADLFEVKDRPVRPRRVQIDADGDRVVYRYRCEGMIVFKTRTYTDHKIKRKRQLVDAMIGDPGANSKPYDPHLGLGGAIVTPTRRSLRVKV